MRAAALAALVCAASPASAQTDLFSRETISGLIDLRLAASDGERPWTDGGFGKTRYGDGLDGGLAEAALVWKPRLGWEWSGVVHLQHQPELENPVDAVEAYLSYRPAPRSPLRLSARAGLFWPPVSLEHDAPAWGVGRSITPSAINSWIGEEVKVAGLELRAERPLGDHGFAATAAVFGHNDTAGTLLSFRGWALHDVKAGGLSAFPLPPLSPYMQTRQAPITNPAWEIDNDLGGYARLDWTPPGPASLNLVYYDNGGDPEAVRALQWGWDTRFWNAGARLDLGGDVELLSQVMAGETLMGFPTGDGLWVDVGYRAAYLLASRRFGEAAASVRLDWFRTDDNSLQALDNNDEDGWAALAAWRRPLNAHAELLVEALHVTSDRPSRGLAGAAPEQAQTTVQTALRIGF